MILEVLMRLIRSFANKAKQRVAPIENVTDLEKAIKEYDDLLDVYMMTVKYIGDILKAYEKERNRYYRESEEDL